MIMLFPSQNPPSSMDDLPSTSNGHPLALPVAPRPLFREKSEEDIKKEEREWSGLVCVKFGS